MKQIPLTQGKVAIVRDDWYEYLNRWEWFYHKTPTHKTGYAVRNEGKYPNRTLVRMHDVIMNPPAGMEVDHIDHNGCHNWPENLRICTRSQNRANQFAYKNNKSGYKRVSWNKWHSKWQASIKVNCKQIHLGYFSTPEAAALAYNNAAIKHFGEFANLNVIGEVKE